MFSNSFQFLIATAVNRIYPLETCSNPCYIIGMAKQLTLKQLQDMFPDDDVCLEHIMRARYGEKHVCGNRKCQKTARYHRVKGRRAYECEWCGYQVYPTAGTPFDRTRTPLTVWFHVMHMFCSSRNGVAAKEVQRVTGVTYKTAWRMCHEIRKYMGKVDGDHPLGGDMPLDPIVEADKAFIGGKDKQGKDDKTIVLGMVERGGDVITRIIPDRTGLSVTPHIREHIKDGSRIATDAAYSFNYLHSQGYKHKTVNHRAKEYVRGLVHTNTIEAFWANLKRGISGTYVWVSKKHLQKYLWEFEFRHNLRNSPELMMPSLLRALPSPVDRHGPSDQEAG
jgi:transposase-like protein